MSERETKNPAAMEDALTQYASSINWMTHTDQADDNLRRVWIGSGDGRDLARWALGWSAVPDSPDADVQALRAWSDEEMRYCNEAYSVVVKTYHGNRAALLRRVADRLEDSERLLDGYTPIAGLTVRASVQAEIAHATEAAEQRARDAEAEVERCAVIAERIVLPSETAIRLAGSHVDAQEIAQVTGALIAGLIRGSVDEDDVQEPEHAAREVR